VKLPVYPNYASTHDVWVGSVPSHWKLIRADFTTVSNKEQISAAAMEGIHVLHYSIPHVQESGTGQVEEGNTIDSAKLRINATQLLVSKLNPRKTTICIAEPDPELLTVCSGEFVPIIPEGDLALRYCYYTWISDKVTKRLSSRVQSVTRSHQRVSPEDITKLPWAWPPRAEQQQIAAFLDWKTRQIDELIARKRQLLDRLMEKRLAVITQAVTRGLDPTTRLRDSGIPWLGQVPGHWRVRRLKFTARERLQYGANESAELDDPEYPRYIRITDIKENGTLHEETFRSLPPEVAEPYLLQDGDLLLARSGATVGKTLQYLQAWGKAAYAGYLIRFRADPELLYPRFAYYFLRSQFYWACINASLIQATIQNFSAEKYADINVPLPPLKEQEAIVAELDEQKAKIDNLEAATTEAIARLAEYRAALITAATTGSIDVRNVRIP
jgi:restriction endonuclease S subunit